jgi:hypothetical protein
MATTEPTQSPAGDLAKVVVRVKALRTVHQTSGTFFVMADIPQPPYRAEIPRPTWQFVRRGEESIVVVGTFEFAGGKKHEPDGQIGDSPVESDFMRITATFEATYEIEPGEPLADEDIEAFANVNTQLNVYPFWREFVHSALGRAGVSPFLLPPYNPFKAGVLRSRTALPTPSTPEQGPPAT